MKTFIKLLISAYFLLMVQICTFAQPTNYADYYPFNGNLTSAVYGSKSFNPTSITFTADKDGNANSACAFTTQSAMSVYGIDQSSIGWTISFLIKITDASGSCILHSAASGYYSSMLVYGSNSLTWYGSSSTAQEFTTPVVLNKWYNVVIVNSGGNSANFYINGNLFGTGNAIGLNYLVGNSIYFGQNNSIPSFAGVLDEVRFYNRPLTTTEIAQYPDPNSTSIWQQSIGGVYYSGKVGIGTATPLAQLHLASDADHTFEISRANGTYGFRIFRNAQQGNVSFQIGTAANTWETKIKIGEGEGANTKLLLNPDGGNVIIGKTTQTNTAYKLDVAGSIRANEIKVNSSGADFVFEPFYKLRPLAEVESFIKQHKHLQDVAPAADMQADGVSVAELQTKLLQKIEELTLYVIEQQKQIEALKLENKKITEKVTIK